MVESLMTKGRALFLGNLQSNITFALCFRYAHHDIKYPEIPGDRKSPTSPVTTVSYYHR